MKMNDPMENQFTGSPVAIDMTRQNGQKDTASLGSVTGETPTEVVGTTTPAENATTDKPKKMVGEVVQGADFNPSAVQRFDPTSVIPKKEKPAVDPTTSTLFSQLDQAVEREKGEISRRHKELEEKMYEDYLEKQDEEDTDEVPQAQQQTNTDEPDDDLDDSDSSDVYSSGDPEATYVVPDQTDTSDSVSSTTSAVEEDQDDKEFKVKEEEDSESYQQIVRTVADYDVGEFEKDFHDDDDDDDFDSKDNRPTEEEIQERERKEAQEIMDGLKDAAKDGFSSSIFDKIDLRQFSISKTPIKASSVIVHREEGPKADWVLYEAGKCISMSAFSGPELIQLDPSNSNRNRMNTLIDIYKIIYNHVVDDKKPPFEKWMMQTKYNDLDHIYFCGYMATFGSSNYLSYQCNNPDCKHIFMQKAKFEDLVHYKSDAVKNRVQEILSQDTNNGIIKYTVDLVQASNTYVFGMRTPSLYNVAMENAGLSDNIIQKYGDMINLINYIDSVYTIDMANKRLVPIAIPQPKDKNPTQAITKKIKVLYRILRLLSSDEYYALRSYMVKAEQKASDDITYFIPEAKCPECGKTIAKVTDMTANALLFTRHHLGAFASM